MNVRDLVGQLTPGQRWTSATCVGLAGLVLLFGMPSLSGDPVMGSAAPPAGAAQVSDAGAGAQTDSASTAPTAPPAADVLTVETTTTTTTSTIGSTAAVWTATTSTTSTTSTSTTSTTTTTTTTPAPPVTCPLPTVAGVCITPPV